MENNSLPTTTPRFSLRAIISNAWADVSGAKGIIWSSFLIMVAVAIGFGILTAITSVVETSTSNEIVRVVVELVQFFFQGCVTVFFVGVYIVAINKVRHTNPTIKTAFNHLTRFWKTFFTWLFLTIIAVVLYIIGIGLFFAISYGTGHVQEIWTVLANSQNLNAITLDGSFIKLAVTYFIVFVFALILVLSFLRYSLPLVYDQQLTPFQAIGRSIKMVAAHWFRNFILVTIVNFIVGLVLVVPILLGMLLTTMFLTHWWTIAGVVVSLLFLVWILPYFYFLYARAYEGLLKIYQHRHPQVNGIEQHTDNQAQ